MKWHIQSKLRPSNLSELRGLLLANRQITDEEAFFKGGSPLNFSLEELGFDLRSLAKIKERLAKAKQHEEEIVVFGDYDADGICATAVLWQVLHQEGYKVWPFIPHRLKHGYGLSVKALEDLLAKRPATSLIITVDNGIVAHKALSYLAKKKIDAIVTDHHQPDGKPIKALAVFHSTQICGCSVAWFLAREISADQRLLTETLALAAIATVTDLMPLLDFNRSIVLYGLLILRSTKQIGLRTLFDLVKINQAKIDTYTLGFQIGPRLNAMGRLADGMDALRLLCTRDQAKAKSLADLLVQTNQDRQNLTFDLSNAAEEVVTSEADEALIFLSSPEYHEGIIGLIAGKMTEKFNKPSIVISIGQEVSKASARSLPGFNITEFIRSFQDDLLEMGGHPLAAGFAVATDKIELVKQKMQAKAKQMLHGQSLEKTLEIDAVLPLELLNLESKAMIDEFAPFGLANQKPAFVVEGVKLKNYRLIGQASEHLKLFVSLGDQEFEVLAWGQAALLEKFALGDQLDLAFTFDANYYQGRDRLQLICKDIRLLKKKSIKKSPDR